MGERLLIISVVILQLSILIVILQSSIFNVSRFDYVKLVEQWPPRFDYLKLVEQWAPSTCNEKKNNPCGHLYRNNFTIHGLWPEFDNAEAPSFCSKTQFDRSKITALEHHLNIHWPNLEDPTNYSKFWELEWRKHGTSSESTFDQLDYFNLTLELKGRLNLYEVLQDAKITPGGTYPAINISNAIKKKTQVEPLLRCNSPYKSQTSQLWEVALCFDSQGANYINCPTPRPKPTAICNETILFSDSSKAYYGVH